MQCGNNSRFIMVIKLKCWLESLCKQVNTMHIHLLVALWYFIMLAMTGTSKVASDALGTVQISCVANRFLWQLRRLHWITHVVTCITIIFSLESRIVQRQDCTWHLMSRDQHVQKCTPLNISYLQQNGCPTSYPQFSVNVFHVHVCRERTS